MEKIKKDLERAIRHGDGAVIAQLRREHDQLPSLEGSTFENASISSVDLSHLDLTNTEWASCMMERVRFKAVEMEGAYFRSCIFVDATFEKSRFNQTAIDGSVFRNCQFIDVDFEEVEWTGGDYEGCTFTRCRFDESELDAVTFAGGKLEDVIIQGGALTGVTFRDVEQERLSIIDASLSGCSGSGTLPEGFRALTGRRKVVSR